MRQIPKIEFQSPEKVKTFQEARLRKLLDYLYENSPFYKRYFKLHNISTHSINTLEDLVNVPPTTKDQLQLNNWDFLCVPKKKIIEYTTTSGTLGKPVTIALTENDIQRLNYNEYLSLACANGKSEDIYQLMVTLDRQFMAGIAYYGGIRKLGAGLIRVGPGLPGMQLETIQKLKPTILVAVPSFIVRLIELAKQEGINLSETSVKKIICIGESVRSSDFKLNVLGKKIAEAWDIQLYSTYASTEMQTAFTECGYGNGGHLHPELLYVELLDENDYPVRDGEFGEVTITTFEVEGMPLLRYKTGDIAMKFTEFCNCGRTTLRLGPILGRKQQMIKLNGTTIYPQGIYDILDRVEHIQDYLIEAFTGPLGTDMLSVNIVAFEDNKTLVESNLRSALKSGLRIVPVINFTVPSEIERKQQGGRKAVKFIDNRF